MVQREGHERCEEKSLQSQKKKQNYCSTIRKLTGKARNE